MIDHRKHPNYYRQNPHLVPYQQPSFVPKSRRRRKVEAALAATFKVVFYLVAFCFIAAFFKLILLWLGFRSFLGLNR